MKKYWLIGIVILCLMGYFGWNGFGNSYFIFNPKEVKGKIYAISEHSGNKGHGMIQRLYYFYQYDNKWYKDYYHTTSRNKYQQRGNSILLEISKSNPANNKVIGFYKREVGSLKFCTHGAQNNSNLTLDNGVFTRTDYLMELDSTVTTYGIYKQVKNQMEFIPVLNNLKNSGGMEMLLTKESREKKSTYTVKCQEKMISSLHNQDKSYYIYH